MFALWRLWRHVGGWRALLAQGMLAWRLFRDGRVPLKAKLIPFLGLIYFISPINLSFQWIPILGQFDDLFVATLVLGAFMKACPDDIIAWHARKLEREMTGQRRFESLGRFAQYVRPSFSKWTGSAEHKNQKKWPWAA